jgi:hypothetical protein
MRDVVEFISGYARRAAELRSITHAFDGYLVARRLFQVSGFRFQVSGLWNLETETGNPKLEP